MHFLGGDRKGKAFCERPLTFALYRQQPENEKQNIDFAPPAKISADAHACVVCVYNLTCACYWAMNNHFVSFQYPFGQRVVQFANQHERNVREGLHQGMQCK